MSAERYTHGHHESVLRSHTWRTVENSAAYLIPHLKAGAELLDVGCGPGTITVDFAERLAPGRVVGMDASAEIVAKANALASERVLATVSFVAGSAYSLDFADGSFDIAHAHQVLQHVGDPVAVLAEMRRVVRVGGVVAARDVDYGGTMWFPRLPGLDEWMRVYDAVHRANGGEPHAGRRLKAWARAAGLSELASTASIWNFSSDADREWWGNSWSVRATESDFARQAIDQGIADRESLRRISSAWLEWAGHPDGWFAMPHGEIIGTVPAT